MRGNSAGIEHTKNTVKGMESAALKTHMQFTKKWLLNVKGSRILMIEKFAMPRSESP
jgi:hypothetical protein